MNDITTPFYRNPALDSPEVQEQCFDAISGAHRYFRLAGPAMQLRFADLVDHKEIPRILIHGNPHIANYCKTQMGTAMVDFDRSRIGPYAYDLVRFMISVSLSRQTTDEYLLHPIILDHFRRGYTHGLLNREQDFEEMHSLRIQEPKNWQLNTENYLESGKKWAKRLDQHTVALRKRHLHLLRDYFANRNESELLESHEIQTVAEVPGSMGKLHIVYLLRQRENQDPLLIDIKEVYDEEDNEWYSNPYAHNGIRMNEAGKIYAPGWELRPGHATWKDIQYWGREIPTQQVKLSNSLQELDQCDLCFSVGTQLGRGHSLAADKSARKAIKADFESRFQSYIEAADQMRHELMAALTQYRRDMNYVPYERRKINCPSSI